MSTTNGTNTNGRLQGHLNGASARKAREPKPAAESKSRRANAHHLQQAAKWADRYVWVAITVSSVLNAVACVHDSHAEGFIAGAAAAVLGGLVPILVWLCGRQAGYAWRAKARRLAYGVGAAGLALLILSITHCAAALAHLTGAGFLMALLLAVGIDYGLVASEVLSIGAQSDE